MWIARFLIDLARIMLVAVIAIILSFIFQLGISYIWLPILLYPFATTPLNYVFGLIPYSPQAAQIMTSMVTIILGAFVPIVVYVLRLIDSTRSAGVGVMWGFRWFPSFSLADGIVNLAAYQAINRRIATSDSDYFAMDSMGGDLVFFPVGLALYFIILVLMQSDWNCKRSTASPRNDANFAAEFPQGVDSDVEEERRRLYVAVGETLGSVVEPGSSIALKSPSSMRSGSIGQGRLHKIIDLGSQMEQLIEGAAKDHSGEEQVRVMDLQKKFGKLKAVRYLSFAVDYGEVFALLGVNGAGKSTTFKVLTGEVRPTQGRILIHGHDVTSEFREVRRYIGYCPQIDPIIPNLTVREHL